MTIRMKKIVTTLMASALMLTSVFSASSVAFASSTENVEKETNAIAAIGDTPKATNSTLRVEKGRSYLGHFTFNDQNRGLDRYYMGSHVRLCIAWKAADGYGDIDLNIKFFGKDMKFKCSEDADVKDCNGYYFGKFVVVILYGNISMFIYDALT